MEIYQKNTNKMYFYVCFQTFGQNPKTCRFISTFYIKPIIKFSISKYIIKYLKICQILNQSSVQRWTDSTEINRVEDR